MSKERKGYTYQDKDGKWIARMTYTDEAGKRRNVKRKGINKTEAKDLLKQMIRTLDDQGTKVFDNQRMTFRELANYYADKYIKPAQYVDDRKVAGLRSYKSAQDLIKVLIDYFGDKLLKSLTYTIIEKFKSDRLAVPTVQGKQRSIARVNREMTLLRRILNIAIRDGFITQSPFSIGSTLISASDERKRERIITKTEEERLLEACTGVRAHLRPIVICALDTGMRSGEIFSLQWGDIDFTERLINIKAFNTKTMRQRQVAMTNRLSSALLELYEKSEDKNALVFGIQDNVKRSFTTIRRIAGLTDVRFHDLRHTAATRLVAQHVPLSEVGRVLGHTQANTTYRYVNANADTARRAAAALDDFHAENEREEEGKEGRVN